MRASKRHSLRGFGNETERGGFIKNLFTKFVTKLLSHLVPCSCFEDDESLLVYARGGYFEGLQGGEHLVEAPEKQN